jgi:hypothetical protein
MKKGLLTVLLASLVLVGCQNYDDQFDDLNAQISALKSQVDGLSSLSGQVSSLAGSISGLQSGVAAAQAAATAAGASADAATAAVDGIAATDLSGLEASLATLAAEVEEVQASLATASTAAAVTALQAEVTAIQTSVQELLDTSNIYSTAVSVTNASTLDAALALGNKLNILNNSLTITATTSMDMAKVQTLVDRVFTMTGTLSYTGASSTSTEITFDKLTSAADIDVDQAFGYSFKALASAQTVNLRTTYTTTITNVDLGALTSATTVNNGTANTISFPSATNIDLGSLTRYGASLTIAMKKGGTLDIASLDDVDAAGDQSALALDITGPASLTITKLDGYGGSMALTNVATASVTDYNAVVTVNGNVDNLTLVDVKGVDLSSASDLETASIDLARDDYSGNTSTQTAAFEYDGATATAASGDITIQGKANLTSLTISGSVGDVVIGGSTSGQGNANLASITMSAAASDLSIVDNDNLTSVTLTGAQIGDLTVSGNADLASLTADHTTKLRQSTSTATTMEKGAVLTITDNPELASLTFSADDVLGMVMTNNAKLATVDFTGLADDGSAAADTQYAHIWANNFTASKARETTEETALTSATQYTSADLGAYTTTSGLGTLKAWLDHVVVNPHPTNGVFAYWDTITAYESNSAYNGAYTAGSATDPAVTSLAEAITNKTNVYAIVAKLDAVVSATVSQIKETQTVVFPITTNASGVPTSTLATDEAVVINVNGVSVTYQQGELDDAGNTINTVADMVAAIDGASNWGSSVTVAAANAGYERAVYRVNYVDSNGAAETTSGVGGTGTDDTLWWSIAGHASGSLSIGHNSNAADIASLLATSISNYQAAAGNYPYNATYISSSDDFVLTATQSKASYPSSLMPGQSFPSISFVVDAAETSTTARLGGTAQTVSNSAALNSDVFLSVSKNEVPGLRVTLTNNTNVALFSTGAASAKVTITATTGSTFALGNDNKISTSGMLATTSAVLISGTHHAGSSLTKVATEMAPSSGGATTQAACVTDRTGWLG